MNRREFLMSTLAAFALSALPKLTLAETIPVSDAVKAKINPQNKLGFGFMRLPLKDPKDQTAIDYNELNKMVDLFLERGFNYFDKPADEPVLAMAMAIFQCLPTQEKQHGGIMFVPSCFGKVKVNLRGDIYIKGQKDFSDVLVHFATPNTKLFTYKFAAYSDECNCYGRNKAARIIGYCKYRIQTFPQTCVSMIRHEAGRLIRKFYSENRKG